jgi:mannonate dehydratase
MSDCRPFRLWAWPGSWSGTGCSSWRTCLPPEDIEYFRLVRQISTPLATGEPFTGSNEYLPLIRDRLLEFLRVPLSAVGGLSMGRKLAALCEFFGVCTAWHGPGDVSPIGHAANLALDLACHDFGTREQHLFGPEMGEVFAGCPEIQDGHLWANEAPGPRRGHDEQLPGRFAFPDHAPGGGWDAVRREDGTVIRP